MRVVTGVTALAAAMEFHAHQREEWTHELGYPMVKETYRSDAMPLAPGQVVFTDKDTFMLKFPQPYDPYAITKFHAEVTDDQNKSVPLDEVYNHHWLIFNSQGNRGVCGGYLSYIFGVGQECRNTPVVFPAGTGYVAKGSFPWFANIHLLRTQGLHVDTNMSQAVKDCIECSYTPEKGCSPEESGMFACCGDGSRCPVDSNQLPVKNYYLSYTMEYTTNASAVKPVRLYVLDGSNCQIEYNIQADEANPYQVTEHSWTSPASGEIAFTVGHVHNSGINISLLVNNEIKCTSIPTYGTEVGKAGNEKGYIVEFSSCSDGFSIKAGDTIGVKAVYYVGYDDQTGSGIPGGSHGGVMALFYLGAVEDTLRDAEGNKIEKPWELEWQPAPVVV
mmetsp:Transcript_58663/g.132693  ORF Transcript_58663/g.132693 Transcript_58663/m.132693 type:complete len:389 (+) Transcript_58663:32-1198(+)|eukprot:CAMPEP_0204338306 /NCGR_PEP_ID=MMETSP0469-20131031/20968_1 /ASSEMBLY_ACC=CAM_ASM_000384 /TAXON_ID=2969 /ORGANISM="Oxyrrhis marina" /LENGTH=388 /DNA_ID=CAMNT_0051322459 /DNA_START=27 /DNA_END=1193 /DNA_ORIENTATION=-